MTTDAEIATELRRLLHGEVDLDAFEEWFVVATWDFNSPLARQVTAVLAESAGNADAGVAVEALAAVLARTAITVPLTFSSIAPSGHAVTVETHSEIVSSLPAAAEWFAGPGSPVSHDDSTTEPSTVVRKRIEWPPNITVRAETFQVPAESRS